MNDGTMNKIAANVLFIGIGLAIGVWMLSQSGSAGGDMYSCSGSYIASKVKHAIENGPFTKLVNVSVYKVENNHELSREDKKLHCSADVYMNSGKMVWNFSLEDQGRSIWLQGEGAKFPGLE